MSFGAAVKTFICTESGLDDGDISSDTLLFTDGYIDSFTMASLIGFIEEETGIMIAPSEVTLENFDTIADIEKFVASKQDA